MDSVATCLPLFVVVVQVCILVHSRAHLELVAWRLVSYVTPRGYPYVEVGRDDANAKERVQPRGHAAGTFKLVPCHVSSDATSALGPT
jgi:hypothetical protein